MLLPLQKKEIWKNTAQVTDFLYTAHAVFLQQ